MTSDEIEDTDTTESSEEVEIYVAEDLRNPRANSPQHVGSVPQEYMEEEGRLILRPLNETDRKIVSVFDECYRFDEFWNERPYRGVYILGDNRNNIVDGETPFIDDVPALQRFYLKPDGLLHIDLNNLSKSNKEGAEKTMKPRLLFKVLRGSHAIIYKDGTGRFASTGDIVNAPIDADSTNHSLSTLFLTLNSPIISFYLQQVVYSGSTETARNLDAPYLQNIPIPEVDQSQTEILERLSDCLLFTHQYEHDQDVGERVGAIASFYADVVDALIADLFYDFEEVDLWDTLTELPDIPYEHWADERFSNNSYPTEDAEEMWSVVNNTHDELDTECIRECVDEIENDERIERIEAILNQ